MISPDKYWADIVKKVYKSYGENPGTMLLHTGAVGWVLSSLGQISGILMNNKISPEQKMFLIPQECSDAFVNIVSFYTLTSGVKFIGSKLSKTGKIRTSAITNLLKERGLILEKGQTREAGKVYAGDWNFDITKLNYYRFNIAPDFKPFNNGMEVIFGLIGSIISSNLVTPVVRNYYASKRQKDIVNQYQDWKKANPEGPKTKLGKSMMESFTSRTSSTYPFSGGNLKI